jgi:uncharacterized protein
MISPTSELAQRFWAEPRLADCPILDFHAHMYDAAGLFLPCRSPEAMVECMELAGTVLTCFCGHEAMGQPSLPHPSPGEAKDIAAVRKFPDRLRAYHAVVSRHLSAEADIACVERNPDVFLGWKFHPDWYAVPLSDPRHDPYWEYADARGLLVLSHTWGGSANDGPDEAEKILRKYPNLVFIAGHSFHMEWRRAAAMTKTYPNFYLELTAVLDDRGGLDQFVEVAGSQQILFGTDLPWFSTHHGIGAVLSADITDDDRRNVLYRNGAKLLARYPWFEGIWRGRGAE